MEIILVVVVLGLVAYWAYSVNQKRKQDAVVEDAPYKVESPVATPVVSEPVRVEAVAPVVEVAPVTAPVKAKAPIKAKAPVKPKAVAITANAKAPVKAKAPRKLKVQ